jgi:hypothetical protein
MADSSPSGGTTWQPTKQGTATVVGGHIDPLCERYQNIYDNHAILGGEFAAMIIPKRREVWFLTGSQAMYGEQTLRLRRRDRLDAHVLLRQMWIAGLDELAEPMLQLHTGQRGSTRAKGCALRSPGNGSEAGGSSHGHQFDVVMGVSARPPAAGTAGPNWPGGRSGIDVNTDGMAVQRH